jgi:hydrogenase expression/formation protein HypD
MSSLHEVTTEINKLQPDLLKQLEQETAELLEMNGNQEIRIMEFCGGHTHSLVQAGILSVLPKKIKMVHGPGCPVCVLPATHLQAGIDLMEKHSEVSLAVYGDVMRIPTLKNDSLLQAKGRGLDVRMIYSPLEIIKWAQLEPAKQFVFLALGFETTSPATALLIKQANKLDLKNVSVICLHVLTPPAVSVVMSTLPEDKKPQALIGPGHVSLVTGIDLFEQIGQQYKVPVVVSGFEPSDLLSSLIQTIKALKESTYGVINQYSRALKNNTHFEAQKLLNDFFEIRQSFHWRGLGEVANSAVKLKDEWSFYDAEKRFEIPRREVPEHPQCQCGAILMGQKSPKDCRLFLKACTPSHPWGSCMVSSEGACHAYHLAGDFI